MSSESLSPDTSSRRIKARASEAGSSSSPADLSSSEPSVKEKSPETEEPALSDCPGSADGSLELPHELVARIRDVVAERCRVEGLIDAAAEGRSEVKNEIYLKVQADYESQVQAVRHAYEPLRREAVESLMELRRDEAEIRSSLERVEDELAELRFRCRVGEFGEDELARAEKSRLAEVALCETRLERLRATFALAESLLGEGATGRAETTPIVTSSASEESQESVGQSSGSPPIALIEDPNVPDPNAPVLRDPDPDPNAPVLSDLTSGAIENLDARTQVEAVGHHPTPPPTALPDVSRVPPEEGPAIHGASLVMLSTIGEEVYPITPAGLTIGRSKTNHVVLAEPGVSRKHAVIKWRDGEMVIEDRSSGGGVVLNGQFVDRAALKPGDVLQIVSFSLRVRA